MEICAKEEVPRESNVSVLSFADVARFLRNCWPRLLAISFAVITPCLWHSHIEAGDLPSHVYNAWLVHFIKTGPAPGLWLARRSNNVLFDHVLSGLGKVVGWGAADKIATCGAVLIFFWGAFALVCAMTRRPPWFFLPCLAMVAYGWTFEMGFMNCYISIGLACFGLAILVRGRGWERGLAAALAPLVWLAHPMGLALLATVGVYVVLAEHLPLRHRLYLFITSVLLLVGVHFFIQVHYPSNTVFWRTEPHLVQDGFNQLLLYGPKYLLPARLFRAFLWACLLVDLVRQRHTPRWWSPYLLPSELYAISLVGVVLLPAYIVTRLFNQIGFHAVDALPLRLTTVSAILVCCLLCAINPQKWHLVGFSVVAVIFFFFLYHDTAKINHTEDQLDGLVCNIPPGQRVVATIATFPSDWVTTTHIIDRACIGHCISYANYEPATGQFRVRANFGNSFVMTDNQQIHAVYNGNYVVQARDLPLFEIYQCDLRTAALCVRELAVGDKACSAVTKRSRTWVARFNGTSLLFDLLLAPVIIVGAGSGRWLIARLKQGKR